MGLGLLTTSFSEAGVDALLAGGAALGPEAIAGELAIMGLVIGIKKMKEHHQAKKQRRADERQRSAEEQKYREEEEYQAQQAEIRRQEEAKQKEEEDRRKAEEEAKQAEIARQQEEAKQAEIARQQEEERQQQEAARQVQIEQQQRQENVNRVEQNVSNEQQRLAEQRRDRIAMIEGYPGQSDLPWIANYIFPQSMLQNDREPPEEWLLPDDFPDQGPNDPDGGGNGDPDGGDPDDPFDGDPNDNPHQNPNGGNGNYAYRYDPFSDMVHEITRQIARNAYDDRRRKQQQEQQQQVPLGQDPATWSPTGRDDTKPPSPDEQSQNYPGKGGAGTYQGDKTKQQQSQQIDYNDELHLMEYEMAGIIEGLSQQELTLEESMVQIAKLEQGLKERVPQQVRVTPSSIYSKDIATF